MKTKDLENILSDSLDKMTSPKSYKTKTKLKHCKKCGVYYILNHICK